MSLTDNASRYVSDQQRKLRIGSYSFDLYNLLVVPAILLAAVLPLYWFSRNWIFLSDDSWYAAIGSNLWAGEGYEILHTLPFPLRGPVLPIVTGFISTVLGTVPATLAWSMRLLDFVNPLLLYVLVRRFSNPWAAILSAVLLSFFGVTTTMRDAFSVDSVMLLLFLLYVITLYSGVTRGSLWHSTLSGVLLGTTILTKETALTTVPLALVAFLFHKWDLRGLVGHYIGLAAACLPWWVWVWITTGQIFLLQNSQAKIVSGGSHILRYIAVAVVLVGVATLLAYKVGLFQRVLRNQVSCYMAGWVIATGWSAALYALFILRTNLQPREKYPDTASYVAQYLLPGLNLWYLFVPTLLFAVWMAFRGERKWSLFLAMLVLWIPVIALAFIEKYATRQFIVWQVLLYGGFAILLVFFIRRAFQRRVLYLLAGALAIVSIIWSGVSWGYNLRTQNKPNDQFWNVNNSAVEEMASYIKSGIPSGATISANEHHFAYSIAYQDGGRHSWYALALKGSDDRDEYPQVNIAGCLKKPSSCPQLSSVIFLTDSGASERGWMGYVTLSDIVGAMRRENARYLLLSSWPLDSDSYYWEVPLEKSHVFLWKQKYILNSGHSAVILLQLTDRQAEPIQVSMNTQTLRSLVRRARSLYGDNYKLVIRRLLPNGINITGTNRTSQDGRALVRSIYGQR